MAQVILRRGSKSFHVIAGNIKIHLAPQQLITDAPLQEWGFVVCLSCAKAIPPSGAPSLESPTDEDHGTPEIPLWHESMRSSIADRQVQHPLTDQFYVQCNPTFPSVRTLRHSVRDCLCSVVEPDGRNTISCSSYLAPL